MSNRKRPAPGAMGALALAMVVMTAGSASAYVGPGAGLSAIGSVLAFLGVVFLIIVGFFWYPFKRLIARMRGTAPQDEPEAQDQDRT